MNQPRKLVILLVILALLSGAWVLANPPGRFGWCSCYALTNYSVWPRLVTDVQIRADGTTRQVEKTHELNFADIEWLLTPKPEILIIALGWDGVTTPDARIRGYKDCEVQLLKNKEAIDLYNRLKRDGRSVAIHYHSTC
jgi:hypothetical protein